jgi:hypothetical protein
MLFSRRLSCVAIFVGLALAVSAPAQTGLANRWVLIIRHGEKPAEGPELTPAGEARAKAYVAYFTHFTVGGKPIKIGRLIATKDSKGSYRERLTLTPLSQATGIPLEMGFKNKEDGALVASLKSGGKPGDILICWHHGRIPDMLSAFGADSAKLLGAPKWPDDRFDWVIELHYDASGHLIPKDCKKLVEPRFGG